MRMPTSFLVMFGGQFNWKEKLFLAFAWSPKVRHLPGILLGM